MNVLVFAFVQARNVSYEDCQTYISSHDCQFYSLCMETHTESGQDIFHYGNMSCHQFAHRTTDFDTEVWNSIIYT